MGGWVGGWEGLTLFDGRVAVGEEEGGQFVVVGGWVAAEGDEGREELSLLFSPPVGLSGGGERGAFGPHEGEEEGKDGLR